MRVEVRPANIGDTVATQLVTALNEEIRARYSDPIEGFFFRLDPDEVAPGRGAFVVAWADQRAIGCGAVRLIAVDTAELKRMYVVPDCRRHGVAGAILRHLEDQAIALGASHVVLETVTDPPAAVALYRAAGYEAVPKFGPYVDSEISYCMGKQLVANRG
jgi:GNAT superfamily N-acetyltransferase